MTADDDTEKGFSGALQFFNHEAAGGIVLCIAAVAALLIANSPLDWLYENFVNTLAGIRIGSFALVKPLLQWINEGLMAVFFLLVGLEIKRELLCGELSTLEKAVLPAVAAAGGMVAPALIYLAVNWGSPAALNGWAIPCATDIAFALGALALLGPRIPKSLMVFLLALAILDDLGSIVVIAVFYTADLHWLELLLASVGAVVLWALNRAGVMRLAPYVLAGIFIWVCVLKSGVHATLAGVVVALSIPLKSNQREAPSPLEQLEEALHPWIAFGVMPLFAFANAGVSLAGLSLANVLESVPRGIALGLFVGKPAGIIGATWLAVYSGIATKPAGVTWPHVFGVGLLAGIGFTMSLFIGTLAFTGPSDAISLRLGVLTGSLLSGVAGYLLLLWAANRTLDVKRSP